ncbi:MAG: histidine kinase [Acidobacteriota bacterium]
MLSWRGQLLLWSSIAAVPATQTCLALWLAGAEQPTWWRIFLYHLPLWWFWMALTPVIAALARRFPVDRRGGAMAFAVHLPASLVAVVLHLALEAAWATVAVPSLAIAGPFEEQMRVGARSSMVILNLLAYWAVLAVVSTADVYRRLVDRELENSELRFRLIQARIRALKAQLHPHFMFNALNAVSALVIREDGKSAVRMLDQLAELVRLALTDSADEIRLGDDVSLAENYLAIERVRFDDRLRVRIDVDPRVRDALVPHMLLQPVVENVIRHGIGPKAKGGTIEVHARRDADRVRIEVSDDGVGLAEGSQPFKRRADGGVGLSNTQDRLRQLYGDDFRLELDGRTGGGTRVTFDLPLRLAGEASLIAGDTEPAGAT